MTKRRSKASDLVPRTSPCAGKCRHAWCAGYNDGYSEGEQDNIDGESKRPKVEPLVVRAERRGADLITPGLNKSRDVHRFVVDLVVTESRSSHAIAKILRMYLVAAYPHGVRVAVVREGITS